MGVLNITPDSFSGDGLLGQMESLVADRGRRLEEEGADVLDVGGESTRPGHVPVPEEEEIARVIPAIQSIAGSVSIPVSVDTSKSGVARAALAAGARIVNDVSGLRDPELAGVVAEAEAGIVLVHNRGIDPDRDLLDQIALDLATQIEHVTRAGVRDDYIVVDPGLGFGKDWRANFEVLRRLSELRRLGKPILVGPSRKGMIGRVLGTDVRDRVEGTAALVTISVAGGADAVRVHDVLAVARVVRMADALAGK